MIVLIRDNSQCSTNPLQFSAKLVEKGAQKVGINSSAICSCDIGNVRVYFDKDGVYSENPLLKGGNLTPWAKE